MKNFLELQDTKSELAVSVQLKIHGTVEYYASINRIQFIDRTEITVPLHSEIVLIVQLQEFEQGSSGIEIEKFTVNGLEILPKYLHLADPPTNYIDEYGLWRFAIPAHFYSWYHNITGQGWLLTPV